MKKVYLIAVMLCAVTLTSCIFNRKNDIKLIAVEVSGQWGYIDLEGKYVINPQFDMANPFFDGLARVVSNGKVGYISTKGEYVVQPQYQDGTDFSEGYAFVVTENSYPICINTKGEQVFTLKNASKASIFKDGLAPFKTNSDEGGYINKKGEVVIAPSFSKIGWFYEGLAQVVDKNGQVGYIDKEGDLVIPYQFELTSVFYEGLAMVNNGKHAGYIDKKGKYVINPQFEGAGKFSEGLALVANGGRVGYIDKSGKYVINPQFNDGNDFKKGFAAIQSGDVCGYINKKGKITINPQFDYAGPFFGDLALVASNDKGGFIDKKGKYVINPQFDNVNIYDDDGRYGYSEYRNAQVKSTYYDETKFVSNFFGSGKLGNEILSTFKYGSTYVTYCESRFNSVEREDDYDICSATDDWKLTDDIKLENIRFTFSDRIREAYYDYYYNRNYNYNYNYEAKIYEICCSFTLSGKSYGKGSALACSLADAAKRMHYIPETHSSSSHNVIYGYNKTNKQGIIIAYTEEELHFVVYLIGENEFDNMILYSIKD